MRPFIKNAVSYLERRIEALGSSAVDNLCDAVVSGYSYPLTKCQQTWPSESGSHRQVGILYADIADYTRLSELDEEGAHHRLVESMKIMEAHVAANFGRVAHFAGDAILAEFKDADNALNCAINVQLWDLHKNAGLSSDKQILFRIGVNFGDVIADHGDIFGNDVNLAARLERLACSGGICVSESVRHRLKDDPSFKFVAMGKQYVKNISEPVEAFWIEFDAEVIEPVDHSCATTLSEAVL
jgi:class 3 adenylate cyclase